MNERVVIETIANSGTEKSGLRAPIAVSYKQQRSRVQRISSGLSTTNEFLPVPVAQVVVVVNGEERKTRAKT